MIDERLESAIKQTGARVLILDPIQAYLGGTMAMNRANEARDMTKKLAALAEKYQCAIVLVGHMNKAAGNKAAYRGMGSIDAMKEGSSDRYFQEKSKKLVPEGIVGRVPYRGPVMEAVYQLMGGLRSGMGYVGAHNLTQLFENTTFCEISPAGLRESHVHDVVITKEAPNYRIEN